MHINNRFSFHCVSVRFSFKKEMNKKIEKNYNSHDMLFEFSGSIIYPHMYLFLYGYVIVIDVCNYEVNKYVTLSNVF